MIIGLDVGGTTIDTVAIENGKVVAFKKFERGRSLIDSVLESLNQFISKEMISNLERITLSTTVTTNAIVQNNLDKVGMIIENGIGANPEFLMCGDMNFFADGYINNRGIEVKSLNIESVKNALQSFKQEGIENLGIVDKFSVRNPQHELAVYEAAKEYNFKFVSVGYKLSGKLNFPRRVFSTYLNCAVYSTFNMFYKSILTFSQERKIPLEKIFIQKPDGGIINLYDIEGFPIFSVISGPAASAQGGFVLSNSVKNAIIIDIGGTTTDIAFLSNGNLVLELYGAKIGKYPTLVRAIYSRSVGLGAESIVKIVDDTIKIGPKTKRWYEQDKNEFATLHDVLQFSSLYRENPVNARLKSLSSQLNMSQEDFCKLVISRAVSMIEEKIKEGIEYINNLPVYTINKLLYGEKFAPQKIILIGGPAELLKPHLENELKIKVEVPKHYMVANAIGCAIGSISKEYNLVADTIQGKMVIPELNIYQSIPADFTIDQAKKVLIEKVLECREAKNQDDVEIVDESSFNMIRSFRFCGRMIRIKAQLKPKLLNLRD